MLGANGGSHPGSVVLNALIDLIGGLITKVANVGKEQLGVDAQTDPQKSNVGLLDGAGQQGQKPLAELEKEQKLAEDRLKADAEHNTSAQLAKDEHAKEAMLNQVAKPEKESLIDKVTSSVKSAFKW